MGHLSGYTAMVRVLNFLQIAGVYFTDSIRKFHSWGSIVEAITTWHWSKSSPTEMIFSNGCLKDILEILKFIPRLSHNSKTLPNLDSMCYSLMPSAYTRRQHEVSVCPMRMWLSTLPMRPCRVFLQGKSPADLSARNSCTSPKQWVCCDLTGTVSCRTAALYTLLLRSL